MKRAFRFIILGLALAMVLGILWVNARLYSLPDGVATSGQIVVADAFLAWGKTLVRWSRIPPQSFPPTTPSWWRMRIHVISGVIVLSVMLVAIRLRKEFRISSRPGD